MQVPSLAQMKADLTMSGRLGPQAKRGNWCGIKLKPNTTDLSNVGHQIPAIQNQGSSAANPAAVIKI
jgi:hypothetical protein